MSTYHQIINKKLQFNSIHVSMCFIYTNAKNKDLNMNENNAMKRNCRNDRNC